MYFISRRHRLLVTALVLLLFIGYVVPQTFTDPDHAERHLKGLGYTDIEFSGYDWFSCGPADIYKTAFTAKNAEGHTVSGAVCQDFYHQTTVHEKPGN